VVFVSAGEGTALVAKEFGLQQRVGDGGAVFNHKRAARARRGVVHGAGQQLLAGTRFAQHQHRQIVACHLCRQRTDAIERAARCTHDALEAIHLLHLLLALAHALAQRRCAGAQLQIQARGLALQGLRLHGVAHRVEQVLGRPRFEDVLVDAGFVDAGHDVGALGIARNDDAHHLGPALAHLPEKSHAAGAGHALVAQQHRHRLALEQGAGLFGAASGEHAKVFLQSAPDRFLRTQLVIDHQHGGFGVEGQRGRSQNTGAKGAARAARQPL